MKTRTQSGSILILVAGLITILVMLALAFLQRMRSEAAGSDLVVADTQARIMLNAACCYIQEAARVGYASSPTTVAPGVPDPTALVAFNSYGAARFRDYWSGNPAMTPPTVPTAAPWVPVDLSWFGTYNLGLSPPPTRAFTEKSWVGWYTPPHRGQYLTPWHQQDANVLSWLDSWRQSPAKWEPRLRSRPCYVLATPLAGCPDPNTSAHGDVWVSGGLSDDTYYDGARAELVEHWPIGGLPKLFQMFALQETPYAVYPHAVHCSTAKMAAVTTPTGIPAFDVAATSGGGIGKGVGFPWLAPPQSCAEPVQGKKTLFSHVDGYPDPHLLYHPASDKDRWMGRGTVMDFPDRDPSLGVVPDSAKPTAVPTLDTGVRQDAPRASSMNLGWFRVYRESHDTFIVTCGGGASNGWRILPGDVIEQRGSDVISDTDCPYASASELRDVMDGEVRLWYRVCWQPSIRTSHYNKFFGQSCNQGGSLKYVQRLSEAQVAALPGDKW